MPIFKTKGVCASSIHFDIEGDTIVKVQFTGGCSGNSQGIEKLVEGMKVADAISKLEGIRCGARSTSCPDQLAKALKDML